MEVRHALDITPQGRNCRCNREGADHARRSERRYELSDEELAAWVRDYAAYGQDGLGVKKRRWRKRINQGRLRPPVGAGDRWHPDRRLPAS